MDIDEFGISETHFPRKIWKSNLISNAYLSSTLKGERRRRTIRVYMMVWYMKRSAWWIHAWTSLYFFSSLFSLLRKHIKRLFAVESFGPFEAVCYNNVASRILLAVPFCKRGFAIYKRNESWHQKTKRVINEEIRERSKG